MRGRGSGGQARGGGEPSSDEEDAITDYYAVLGLRDSCTQSEIKRAYRKLARQYHPDKNLHNVAQSKRIFQHITEAHDVLSDPVRRREYDREWGPDVAWCPGGGYARRHGDRDDECGGTGQRQACLYSRRSALDDGIGIYKRL